MNEAIHPEHAKHPENSGPSSTADAEQPVAIVTGAGSGIGRATSIALSDLGYRLMLVGRTRTKLDATAELCENETMLWEADLSGSAANREMVRHAISAFERLDVLVNNAGSSPLVSVSGISDNQIDQIMHTNLIGPTAATAEATAFMAGSGGGRVVSVSSYATVDPFPGLGVYAAAKAGINLLMKAVHNEGFEAGIRSFSVAPGAVETPLLRSLFDEASLPADRCLSPQAVADTLVACATGARDSESGSTILLPSP